MKYKKREVSEELKKKRVLHLRSSWSEKELRQFLYDEKGFEGELQFDGRVDQLPEEKYGIIEDLLFEVNQSYAQADSILLAQRKLILAEIKNFEGEHYFENGNFYMSTGYELKNPMVQLERTESLLRKLLKSIGLTLPIESYLIFMNPNFTLFQAPRHTAKLILPTQFEPFLQKLEMASTLVGPEQYEWASKLVNLHQTTNPFARVPNFEYDTLKKGVYCESCKAFSLEISEPNLVCRTCRHVESIQQAIMRMVDELQLLFPERRITVNALRDWCKLDLSRRQLQYVLSRNLTLFKNGKYSYYVYENRN